MAVYDVESTLGRTLKVDERVLESRPRNLQVLFYFILFLYKESG